MTISLYYGDEEYLLRQEVNRLREAVINPQMGSLGHKRLETPSIGEVLEAIGSICFNMGGKTLIEIQDFPFLSKAASGADEKQLAELMALLENHDEHKHILFVSTKINRSIKFPKWLTAHKQLGLDLKECKTLAFYQADEATQRVIMEAKRRGIQIEPKAAALLVEHQGVSLLPLMTEVEKLSVYAANRTITAQDVAILSNHNENTFHMLADWLQGRNRAEVFHTLDELLLRQHPVQLFGLAQSWLGNIFQLRYWQQKGISEAQMAEMTKKHPFKIKKDLQEFGKVPFARLEKLRGQLLTLEYQSKTGELNAKIALEMLMGS
ncbi:DNA polymerase III subunit delta [Vampirovibrio sp.]|uniref:DNA polymerase III subunit delta n=1 Tax=Vampirovibrio sp. TaxID=2717857 RepID=UPI00359428BE